MFTLNWNDPQTFWLNVTNWALLAMTVVSIAVVAYAAIRQVAEQLHAHLPIGVREPLAAAPHRAGKALIHDPDQRIFSRKK